MASTDRNLIPAGPSVLSLLTDGLKGRLQTVQDYAMLCARAVGVFFKPPHYVSDMLQQCDLIGVGSLPIVLLTGFFIGAVMVVQTAAQFTRFGETSLTGDVVALALVRELGPTITGLLVAGRNSSGIASELGSMVVTEQVDAMRAMGTDPMRKLVAPRVAATIFVMPFLVALADLLGLMGGSVIAWFTLRIGLVEFWTRSLNALTVSDIAQGLAKPLFFGFIVSTVGCYQGLTVRGGTEGVGRATTHAVVAASVMILVSDFFLTKIALYIAGRAFLF